MKVAVICDSPLLKKCLEVFLKEHLSSYSACDFVISDKAIDSEKPVFVIGDDKNSNLRKPFSKSKLIKAAGEYHRRLRRPRTVALQAVRKEGDELEKQIAALTQKFVADLVATIRGAR